VKLDTNIGTGQEHFLVAYPQGLNSFGQQVFSASQSMRVYSDTAPIMEVFRSDVTGLAFARATISGYFVDK
jgi:hypothetical protein